MAQDQWDVLLSCERGAVHVAEELPLQDAAGFFGDLETRDATIVLTVADGHGDPRHYRSARGSQLAIEVAGDVGLRFGRAIAQCPDEDAALSLLRAEVVPALLNRWRQAVATDAAQVEVPDDTEPSKDGDDIAIAYGSTMLVAILSDPWLVLCQIGDGDIVFVGHDRLGMRPVPDDPRLVGHQTTSLCQTDAIDSFRSTVIDVRIDPPVALFMATDGFGNAQTDQPWHEIVGEDLVRYARDNGLDWMREHLPRWAALCASGQGSGDDTSIVLLLSHGLVGGESPETFDPPVDPE